MPSFFQNLFKKESDDLPVVVAEDQPADSTQPNSLLSAMNLPSPFAVSAEEQFMARELIMLMPQQFVRQDAMPGDQLVPLPLEALRVSLQQGRPALRLSQLYLACPSLFSRPVSAAEDVEIVLPFQKVKRMLDSQPGGGNAALISPFAAVMPSPSAPAARGDSPFGPPGSPFSQNDLSPQAAVASPFSVSRAAHESPFAMRAADRGEQAEVLSPASGASLPAVESPPPVNPFQRSETAPPVPPRAAQSPFQLVSPAPPASAEPLTTSSSVTSASTRSACTITCSK